MSAMSSQAGSRASLAQLSSPRAGGRVPYDRADPRAASLVEEVQTLAGV
jgi:hypothetical protein